MRERPILFSGAMVRAILSGQKTQTRRAVKNVPSWDHFGKDIMDWSLSGIHQEGYGEDDQLGGTDRWYLDVQTDVDDHSRKVIRCPYGAPGDRLWARETWGYRGCESRYPQKTHKVFVDYHADGARRKIPFPSDDEMLQAIPGQNLKYPPGFDDLDEDERRWKEGELLSAWWDRKKKIPSIHMPRWACRLELEITGVRVERLQDITEEDATAEGIADGGCLNCGESEPCECNCPEPSRRDSFAHLWMQINGTHSWQPSPWVWVIEFKRVKP